MAKIPEMQGSKIVPFGKYKDQPVELMVADRDYCNWLMAQPWFADKFRDVYNVVVNYGGPPQDSPEHNALQARFLDDDFCLKVARLVAPNWIILDESVAGGVAKARRHREQLQQEAEKEEKKQQGFDSPSWLSKMAQKRIDHAKSIQFSIDRKEICIKKTAFEVGGWDVVFHLDGGYTIMLHSSEGVEYFCGISVAHEIGCFCIEAKPTVGDDYPAILRQITGYRRDGHAVLLVGEFDARGATLEQVRKIFASRGVSIVMLSDVASCTP